HPQKAAMHLRMQGLDAAVEHLGEAGKFGDVLDGESLLTQQGGSTASGEYFNLERGQLADKVDDAGFVRNADQGALDGSHGFSFLQKQRLYNPKTRKNRLAGGFCQKSRADRKAFSKAGVPESG